MVCGWVDRCGLCILCMGGCLAPPPVQLLRNGLSDHHPAVGRSMTPKTEEWFELKKSMLSCAQALLQATARSTIHPRVLFVSLEWVDNCKGAAYVIVKVMGHKT